MDLRIPLASSRERSEGDRTAGRGGSVSAVLHSHLSGTTTRVVAEVTSGCVASAAQPASSDVLEGSAVHLPSPARHSGPGGGPSSLRATTAGPSKAMGAKAPHGKGMHRSRKPAPHMALGER